MQTPARAAQRAGDGGLVDAQPGRDLHHVQLLIIVQVQHFPLAGRQFLRHGFRQVVQQPLPAAAVVVGLLLHPQVQAGDVHGIKGGMHHGVGHSYRNNVRSAAPAGGTGAAWAAAPSAGGAAVGRCPGRRWCGGGAAAPPSASGCAGHCPHTAVTARQASCAITLLFPA